MIIVVDVDTPMSIPKRDNPVVQRREKVQSKGEADHVGNGPRR